MAWGKLKQPEVKWSDHGVPSSDEFGDVYYNNQTPSSGLEESRMVFLGGIGAPDIWRDNKSFTIIETGFGTGLNFFNTWHMWRQTAKQGARLNFISIENCPLRAADIKKALSAFNALTPMVDQFLKQYPPPHAGFHSLLFDDENVCLTLLFGDIGEMLPKLKAQRQTLADAWYLDGFAPNKNPDMWNDTLLHQIKRLSAPHAKLATFTAASDVRRGLENIGFKVKKQKGFGKKRERITAKLEGKTHPKSNSTSIAIIGAGIAGCMLAYKLKKRGLGVILIDKHDQPAQETSSNPAALISPKLALGSDPYDRLLSLSFLHAARYYDQFDDVWLSPRGLLSLPADDDARQYQAQITDHFLDNMGWGQHLSPISSQELQEKYSLVSKYNGMFFPHAGSINTGKLVSQLSKDIPYLAAEVEGLKNTSRGWTLLNGEDKEIATADSIVIASGLSSYNFLDEESPLTPNRGQISFVEDTLLGDTPSLSFGHYLTAPFKDRDGKTKRIIGASHKRLSVDEISSGNWTDFDEGDEKNQLITLTALTKSEHKPCGYKTGLRATTIDHMPIIGQVADAKALKTLPKNRQKIFPNELNESHRQAGLYIMAGLGARGYQLAPLLSEQLASLILAEPQPLDCEILDAIDPARFALRKRRHEKF